MIVTDRGRCKDRRTQRPPRWRDRSSPDWYPRRWVPMKFVARDKTTKIGDDIDVAIVVLTSTARWY